MHALSSAHKINSGSKASEKERLEHEVLVKVLGTAQDGGLPQIGCFCSNCLRAREDPSFARLVASLAILDLQEKQCFLLDATPDIKLQLDLAFERLGGERKGLRNSPDGVLLTHAHIGHYAGLMFFGKEAMATHNLPVYCSSRMESFLAKNDPWSELIRKKNISLCPLPLPEKHHLTPQITLTPFQVHHREEFSDTLGFIISGKEKNLLYIPDIRNWEAEDRRIIDEVENADIALLDGCFFNPQELPDRDISQIEHPLIETSINILGPVAEQGITEIFFTHLNHTNPALDPIGEPRKIIEQKGFHMASERMEFLL